jgi:arylsulfatase A-like enzyme
MKYNTSIRVVFAAIFIVTFVQQGDGQNEAFKKPNIVFIMSDDHGYQAISAYGYGLNHTPHIDSLATNGMLFQNAFVNNSLCAPSRGLPS